MAFYQKQYNEISVMFFTTAEISFVSLLGCFRCVANLKSLSIMIHYGVTAYSVLTVASFVSTIKRQSEWLWITITFWNIYKGWSSLFSLAISSSIIHHHPSQDYNSLVNQSRQASRHYSCCFHRHSSQVQTRWAITMEHFPIGSLRQPWQHQPSMTSQLWILS